MISSVDIPIQKSAAAAIVSGLVLMAFSAFYLEQDRLPGWVAGYMVGLLATALHYLQVRLLNKLENENFFSLYSPMSLARMMIVLLIFITLLILEKFDQFSFTVSFLISYIYHSVINIFLLNKRTNNRLG